MHRYLDLLVRNFNPDTTSGVMCKNHVSVDWRGYIYDCDFNQQLDLPLSRDAGDSGLSIFDVDSAQELFELPIVHDNHCFGCVAGMGSS